MYRFHCPEPFILFASQIINTHGHERPDYSEAINTWVGLARSFPTLRCAARTHQIVHCDKHISFLKKNQCCFAYQGLIAHWQKSHSFVNFVRYDENKGESKWCITEPQVSLAISFFFSNLANKKNYNTVSLTNQRPQQ